MVMLKRRRSSLGAFTRSDLGAFGTQGLIYSFYEAWDDEDNPYGWTITYGEIDETIWSATHGEFGWFTTLQYPSWEGLTYNLHYPTNPTLVNIAAYDYPGLANPANGFMGFEFHDPDDSNYYIKCKVEQSGGSNYRVVLQMNNGGDVDGWTGNWVAAWPAWGTDAVVFAKTGPGEYSLEFGASSLSVSGATDINHDMYPAIIYDTVAGRRVSYACSFTTTAL